MIWMKPLNKQERSDYLKSIGLLLDYVTEQEDEPNIILLRTKKAISIVDGVYSGIEMAVLKRYVLVWTSKHQKARRVSIEHDLRCRWIPGECEVKVPFSICDKILPQLGVRVKRRTSDKQREGGRQMASNLQSLPQNTK